MSEIDKLYMNAVVYRCNVPDIDCNKNCEKCEDYNLFTTDKQLELVKLLSNKCDLTISHFTEWEFIHFDGQEPTEVKGKNFDETLAKLVNSYWENLTEKEQKQIKEILER